jgi:hypothetical protein
VSSLDLDERRHRATRLVDLVRAPRLKRARRRRVQHVRRRAFDRVQARTPASVQPGDALKEAAASSLTSSRSRSRICAWIVTSSAVVGSSAISSFGLQASAIAIIARCRIPPEN